MANPTPTHSIVPANESSTSQDECTHILLHVPLAVVYSVICTLGFPGNMVALWVFFSVKKKKNSIHVFLINLVFADLLLVICLPFRIFYHTHNGTWDMNPTLCTIVSFLFYTNMYISIILLGLISVNRYLKINCSVGMQRWLFSLNSARIVCAVVWFGVSALTFSTYMWKPSDPDNRCFHYKKLLDAKWRAYINMLGLVIFWIVFIALMVSYGKIALKLLRKSKERPEMPNAPRYARSAKKSFFILFVFTFCFVPFHMFRIVYIVTQITESSCFLINLADITNNVALLFTASNSCLDPILYFLLSSSVRKEMLHIVKRVFCVHDVAISESTTSYENHSKIRLEEYR
ncbi:probable G-protein coupled receptor 34 [Melanotaenia boesemani]|uniref:probable G-protein coupled receptor 34 n=1 Tax=Melanotaenia boesemani TaxID=1250792 RepID=UPI001C048095|nr:probable G-protein coupled receptor 34 [Melanotaenia boesemani]